MAKKCVVNRDSNGKINSVLVENFDNKKESINTDIELQYDNEGNILNNNLPLPKNTFILKKEIDKIIFGRSE